LIDAKHMGRAQRAALYSVHVEVFGDDGNRRVARGFALRTLNNFSHQLQAFGQADHDPIRTTHGA
jgi:hypothetical protein